MDEIDKKIIDILKKDSRKSASAIGNIVSLSVPAVLERMKKLERANIITNYTITLNKKAQGFSLVAFILVVLDKAADIENFRKEIIQIAGVLECHHVAGQYDYVLKVCVKDTDDLEHFLMRNLKQIAGVASSNTLISLSVLKEDLNI